MDADLFHDGHTLVVLVGGCGAWAAAATGTAAAVPGGSLAVGAGTALLGWLAVGLLGRDRLHAVNGHRLVGWPAIVGGVGSLVAARSARFAVPADPWYALGVVALGVVLVSQGNDAVAARRLDDGTVRARVTVSVPRSERAVWIAGVLAAVVGVRLLIDGTVGWGGLVGSALLLPSLTGDERPELVALDDGLVVQNGRGGRRFLPWDAVERPTCDGDRVGFAHLRPYPRVYRRIAADSDDAREFLDAVRRGRRGA